MQINTSPKCPTNPLQPCRLPLPAQIASKLKGTVYQLHPILQDFYYRNFPISVFDLAVRCTELLKEKLPHGFFSCAFVGSFTGNLLGDLPYHDIDLHWKVSDNVSDQEFASALYCALPECLQELLKKSTHFDIKMDIHTCEIFYGLQIKPMPAGIKGFVFKFDFMDLIFKKIHPISNQTTQKPPRENIYRHDALQIHVDLPTEKNKPVTLSYSCTDGQNPITDAKILREIVESDLKERIAILKDPEDVNELLLRTIHVTNLCFLIKDLSYLDIAHQNAVEWQFKDPKDRFCKRFQNHVSSHCKTPLVQWINAYNSLRCVKDHPFLISWVVAACLSDKEHSVIEQWGSLLNQVGRESHQEYVNALLSLLNGSLMLFMLQKKERLGLSQLPFLSQEAPFRSYFSFKDITWTYGLCMDLYHENRSPLNVIHTFFLAYKQLESKNHSQTDSASWIGGL